MYIRYALIWVLIGMLIAVPMKVNISEQYATEDIPCVALNNNECIKWDTRTLTFHIKNLVDDKYGQYVREAFSKWTNATNGMFEFEELKKRGYFADIQIKIQDKVYEICDGIAIGCASIHADGNTITEVTIYIAPKSCMVDKFVICMGISDQLFKIGILHELGHALGLGHVDDNLVAPIDLMYYSVDKTMELSRADVQKLKQIYQNNTHYVYILHAPYDAFGNDQVQFVPAIETIDVGDTITWINKDDTGHDKGKHTITSGVCNADYCDDVWGSEFDSGIINPNQSFSFTFKTEGIYPYLCALHPWMIGKVVVN